MIIKNILRFLIISVILVQISWAKPNHVDTAVSKSKEDLCLQNTKYDKMEPSENVSASKELLMFTLKGFQKLSLHYAKKAKNISEQLLKDNAIINSKSAKIVEFKHNLTQFEEKYTLCDGIDELFELVELYSNTTSFYFQLKETPLDDDAKLILTLLRKYGSEELDEESWKLFNVFADKFIKKFEDLKQDLQNEQNKTSEKILKWSRDWYTIVHSKPVTNYNAFEKFFAILAE